MKLKALLVGLLCVAVWGCIVNSSDSFSISSLPGASAPINDGHPADADSVEQAEIEALQREENAKSSTGQRLIGQIKIGNTREQVELILGPPGAEFIHGSMQRVIDYGMYNVAADYDSNGRVADVRPYAIAVKKGALIWGSMKKSVP